jgi:hypothetical protein
VEFAVSFTSPSLLVYSEPLVPVLVRGNEIGVPEIVTDWGSENAIGVLLLCLHIGDLVF